MASTVAFHISPSKEKELILGTNALSRLGVSVSISLEVGNESKICRSEGCQAQVMIDGLVERVYVQPY